MNTPPASKGQLHQASRLLALCRAYLEAKRSVCKQIVAILEAHPDNPRPVPQTVPYTEIHISETITSMESLHSDDDSDVPLVPEETPTLSCCNPAESHAASSSKAEAPRTPSKTYTVVKDSYMKIFYSFKNKLKLIFPDVNDVINTMIYQVKQLEYHFNVLERQCNTVQRYVEIPDVQTAFLQRSTFLLKRVYHDARFQYESVVDCNISKVNANLKEYVHNKLEELERAREAEAERVRESDSPVAGPSGLQNRPSAKTTKEDVSSTTPQRRSTRVSASPPDDPHTPTSSKRTPKHSAKEDPHGQPPSKRTPKHSNKEDSGGKRLGLGTSGVISITGSGFQSPTQKSRDDENVELSEEETSRDTISTQVYDSVADMALAESEDDCEKKARSESPRKTGTKPKNASGKKDRVGTKDSPKTRSQSKCKNGAKTQSPSLSKRDSKTGTKQKKFFTTPTKSKKGYERLPQTDSDED